MLPILQVLLHRAGREAVLRRLRRLQQQVVQRLSGLQTVDQVHLHGTVVYVELGLLAAG